MASSRTTTTGQGAQAATYRLTEPSIIAANPPAPRAPTTSMEAPEPLSATATAGGPDRRVSTGRPGATSSDRVMATASARADIPRSAAAISAGDAWHACIRGMTSGTDTIRSGEECRLASRAAHSTASSDSSDPSTPTTTGLVAMTEPPQRAPVGWLDAVISWTRVACSRFATTRASRRVSS